MSKPKTKTSWEKRFDERFLISLLPLIPNIPNKNVIYDIKHFISQELKREREEMGKALRMRRKRYQYGYNLAVKKNNHAIDNYLSRRDLKEREGKCL